jgi:hypothetical protein
MVMKKAILSLLMIFVFTSAVAYAQVTPQAPENAG